MYQRILVPIDLADVELAKPAIATAVMMAKESNGTLRLINVLPMTPVMLAEYVPPDFEAQQRASAEEAIVIVAKETGLAADKISTVVRQGTVDREILEEAKAMDADLIVMSSHRTGMRTYFLGSNAGHVVRYASLLGAGRAAASGLATAVRSGSATFGPDRRHAAADDASKRTASRRGRCSKACRGACCRWSPACSFWWKRSITPASLPR